MTRRVLSHSCCTSSSAIRFWTATWVLFYGAGLLLRSMLPAMQPYTDTIMLSALAAACFVNFRRNRTLHCGLTGPLFAVAAIVARLTEASVWDLDERVIWGTVLVGVAIAFLIEWRTVGHQERPSNA